MSINTIERILWDIHHDPQLADRFREVPDAVLDGYGFAALERKLVKELDVREIADRGASEMLLFNAWLAINGPGSIPEYLEKMARVRAG